MTAPTMDAGKVSLLLPAESLAPAEARAIADRIGVALRRRRLGVVVATAPVSQEPFTPDRPEHGRRWHRITLDLDRATTPREAAQLFASAGAPMATHVTYTDRMRLCGGPLDGLG